MNEVWKDIKGFEGIYQVSNTGLIKNVQRNHILKFEITKLGYKRVFLQKNKQRKHLFVHQIVARTFIPNPYNLPYVNHKDENPGNNCVDNLEWCTQKYNVNYGNRNKKVIESADSRHVRQLTLDGIFLAEYRNPYVAAELLGYDFSNIYKCCKGEKKYAYNYIWEYV